MEKRKTTIIFVIGVILTIVSSMFLINNKLSDKETQLDEVKLKDIKENNMFAIMVNDGSGKYTSNNQFPGDGYKFNSEKSGCMDNNSQLIPDSLSFDEKEQKAIVNTGQTSYCYLYFDVIPQTLQTLQSKSGSGLSSASVGGMYRYQGADVDNYICLGSLNNTDCKEKTDNMYRIIGITEEGNIKVMKQTKYIDSNGRTTYKWNTAYSVASGVSNKDKCDTDSGCPEWPKSEIYTTLNNTFYNSLNADIKIK